MRRGSVRKRPPQGLAEEKMIGVRGFARAWERGISDNGIWENK